MLKKKRNEKNYKINKWINYEWIIYETHYSYTKKNINKHIRNYKNIWTPIIQLLKHECCLWCASVKFQKQTSVVSYLQLSVVYLSVHLIKCASELNSSAHVTVHIPVWSRDGSAG